MNKESNTYTILYATIMVVLVAVVLAFTSQVLKTPQKENEQIDKMQQILRSVNIQTTDSKNVVNTYRQTIQQELLVSAKTGEVIKSFSKDEIAKNEAFGMDVKKQFRAIRKKQEETLPLFKAVVNNKEKYIIPLFGAGLWNDIWGYISIDNNLSVFGADFGHAGETPGLGAEIATSKFSHQFEGKHIGSIDKGITSIAVVKKGNTTKERDYVDGISGGTLTSDGVDKMLKNCLEMYSPYLMKLAKNEEKKTK